MTTHLPPSPARRRLRRGVRALKAAAAFAIIGMAVVIGAVSLAVPWVVDHPEHVQAFLTQQLGRGVRFKSLRAEWKAAGPVFILEQVTLDDPEGDEPLPIERAEWVIDFYAWLRSDVSLSEFHLVGFQVDVERDLEGAWRVARLGKAGGAGHKFSLDALLNLSGVSLRSLQVRATDLKTGAEARVQRLDARLLEEYGRRHVAGTVWLQEGREPIRFVCTSRRSMRCYAGGTGVNAAQWLGLLPPAATTALAGQADFGLWLDLDASGLQRAQLELSARDLVLRGAPLDFSNDITIEPRKRLERFALAVRFQRLPEGWGIDWLSWDDPAAQANTQFSVRSTDQPGGLRLQARRIDLAHLAPVAALSERLPAPLRRLFYENAPRGTLSDVDFTRTADHGWSGSARVHQVRWQAGDRTPGVGDLSGTLLADTGAFIFLPERDLEITLDYPYVFRAPLKARLQRGTLGLFADPEGLRAELSGFALQGDGFAAHGRMHLAFTPGQRRPFMDAVVQVDSGEVAKARQFWPLNKMPTGTMIWLDQALTSGSVVDGQVVIFGDLAQWPFDGSDGRFEARAQVRDVQLAYHSQWPPAEVARADLFFDCQGMRVQSDQAGALGNTVHRAQATIARFSQPILELHLEGQGKGADLIEFAKRSPIRERGGSYWSGLRVGGTGAFSADLNLPLRSELGGARLFGTLRLSGADIQDPISGLAFRNGNGQMRFTQDGLAVDDLQVRLGDDPASLSLMVGSFASDAAHVVEAALRGDLPLRSVLFGAGGALPLLDSFPGRSAWTVEMAVGAVQPDGRSLKRVTWRSDLRGTASELPAPLRKDADSPLPLSASLDLPLAGSWLDLRLGEILKLRARLPGQNQPLQVDAALGSAALDPNPGPGVRVYGDVAALDLMGWAAYRTEGQGKTDIRVQVAAGELNLAGRGFVDTQFRMQPEDSGTMLRFDGPQIEGYVRLPAQGGSAAAGITAEFNRLHVPEQVPAFRPKTVNPGAFPPVHLLINDLRLGEAQFGTARMEAFPIQNGLRIDHLETNSQVLSMRGQGEWVLWQGVESSRFDVRVTSEDLGKMLKALGYGGLVKGGQTSARITGWWPGAPTQFSLAAIEEGALEAKIGQGRIVEVDPGAGRLLGLVSLQAIPRRLALDFSDFFEKGLSFDAIEGRFELRQGNAYTERLVVKGPAADIVVSGRTGLRQRDYDQTLEVTPRVSGVLPVVGALAAGPVGAAAGLFAQGVLNRPIGKAAQAGYRVTGSWDQPKIRRLPRSAKNGTLSPQSLPPQPTQ